jgi:DNA invertase Pin-like site-specific DNA recombinase
MERRPQFDAAPSHLCAGDVLVLTKLDRMARSVKHFYSIIEQLGDVGADLKCSTRASTPRPGGAARVPHPRRGGVRA